jgi:hypothetical protein
LAAPDIQRGDSGGWVVEYLTLEVYGHLVASDVLRDGYVIPLLDTLEDIRERTHAQEVGLATGVDIACKLGDALIPETSTEGEPNIRGSQMAAEQRALFLESVSLVAPDLPCSLTGPIDGARVSGLNYGCWAKLTGCLESSFGDDHVSSAIS